MTLLQFLGVRTRCCNAKKYYYTRAGVDKAFCWGCHERVA